MGSPQNDSIPSDGSLYQEFLAEREEILRHKWLQSESEGRDIGFEVALVDWMLHHRETWKSERESKQEGSIR